MGIEIIHGKCEAILPTLEAESFHACVTDPDLLPWGSLG